MVEISKTLGYLPQDNIVNYDLDWTPITLTDKAAQELTTRVSYRLGELNTRFNLNKMYLGTFHSICLRWLEEYREYTRLKRNFILMDQFDQQYRLKTTNNRSAY